MQPLEIIFQSRCVCFINSWTIGQKTKKKPEKRRSMHIFLRSRKFSGRPSLPLGDNFCKFMLSLKKLGDKQLKSIL